MIREVVFGPPTLRIVRGDPRCRCGEDRESGRHEPVAECWGGADITSGCPKPEEHHEYRPEPWLARLRRRSWWGG